MPPRSAPLPGPAPVTKKLMFGACGSGGGAGCCAVTLDDTPSASAAAMKTFVLLISVAPFGLSEFTSGRMVVPLRAAPNPREREHRRLAFIRRSHGISPHPLGEVLHRLSQRELRLPA